MTSSPSRLLLVAGARPNFMKVAPLIHAIARHNASLIDGTRRIEYGLVHTGQHYDANMSEVFFRDLDIPKPDFHLEVGSGSHAVQTANVMLRFEPVVQQFRPDWVVVVGDVNSTVACTLVAVKMGIKVAHVEAGLRSYDRSMPEEINRLVTDSVADLLLTPSEDGDENLFREGALPVRICRVGNIMIDSLLAQAQKAEGRNTLAHLGLSPGSFIYVTLHRPSNVDAPGSLAAIVHALSAVADGYQVVFPIHPRTRNRLTEFNLSFSGSPSVRLLDPVGYHDSISLTRHARCVITDSGGLQEESTYFRTPCLTLRPNTERPVTISIGSNQLTTPSQLQADLEAVLKGPPRRGAIPPLWDGQTSERILSALLASS